MGAASAAEELEVVVDFLVLRVIIVAAEREVAAEVAQGDYSAIFCISSISFLSISLINGHSWE